MPEALPQVFVNGEAIDHLSVFDRAFQYGDGLFETLPIRNGQAMLLDRHLRRLADGLVRLAIPSSVLTQVEQEALRLAGHFVDATLKITVTRGQSQRGYHPPDNPQPNWILSFSKPASYPQPLDSQGIRVRLCQTRLGDNPLLAGMKHLNRLEQVLARAEWQDEAIGEGIMCDQQGRVIEATSANLFLILNGRLCTPRLDHCGIAGIMRELVLETAKATGLDAKITDLTPTDCRQAEAMFLTNSLAGILPVASFESTGYSRDLWPSELFRHVMSHV